MLYNAMLRKAYCNYIYKEMEPYNIYGYYGIFFNYNMVS